MLFPEKKYSFYKDITLDSALDFSKRSSFVKEIMLERVYPTKVIIPMKQHYGAPCVPVVKAGEKVTIGQCVGLPAKGTFASPVHCGISGTVTTVSDITLPNGVTCKAVTVESDRKRTHHPSIVKRSDPYISATKVMGIIRNSGIVGMGGEGIPTIAKINRAKKAGVKHLLVNCLQSEPYATSDLIRITDSAEYLIMGAVALAGAVGVTRIDFLISEKRKTEITALLSAMERTAGRYSGYVFNIRYFRERFPQGYYRLVAKALYDRDLLPGQLLEEECSAVLFNCSTVYACWEAIADGMPLCSRVVTVTGEDMKGHNVLAPIGTPVSEIINSVNGRSETTNTVLWGNTLTGVRISDPDNTPIIKTTNAVTVVRNTDKVKTNCIHCAGCVRACPMGLNPGLLKQYLDNRLTDLAERDGIYDCIACGACSYICPSGIDLNETIAAFARDSYIREQRQRPVYFTEKMDIGSLSLLEAYTEEEGSDKENDGEHIILPFEGGKIV